MSGPIAFRFYGGRMKRFIIFLIRMKLKLKIAELFRFGNQKSKDIYFFTCRELIKVNERGHSTVSNVPLNWLLSDECEIVKLADTIRLERRNEHD